jgi:hypothetical protein
MDVALQTRTGWTRRINATAVLFAAFVLIAVCAFLPRLLVDDHVPANVSMNQMRALRAESAMASYFSGLFDLQIIEAHRVGPHPPDIEGTITWRAPFGIPVGTSQHADGAATFVVGYGKAFGTWSAFLLTETVLASLMLKRTWNGW